MAALFVEGLLVAIAVYAISHCRRFLLAPASAGSRAPNEDVDVRRQFASWN
jgi:hypothetical protein